MLGLTFQRNNTQCNGLCEYVREQRTAVPPFCQGIAASCEKYVGPVSRVWNISAALFCCVLAVSRIGRLHQRHTHRSREMQEQKRGGVGGIIEMLVPGGELNRGCGKEQVVQVKMRGGREE